MWRSLDDHWIGDDAVTLALFVRLVMWANLKESRKREGDKILIIPRGSMITSSRKLSESLNVDHRTIERRLSALEKDGVIEQKVTQRGRYITLCNYDKYQSTENTSDPLIPNKIHIPSPHEDTHSVPTECPLMEERKNGKKEKNGEKIKKRETRSLKAPVELSPIELDIATKWLEYSRREMPWKSSDPSWNVQNWGEGLIAVKKKTDLNDDGLRKVLEFVSKDDFWAKNAVSPRQLLVKGKSGNLKIDNILVNLKTKGDRLNDSLDQWVKDREARRRDDPSFNEDDILGF